MELNAHYHNNITVLYLGGRFDAYETPAVVEWLQSTAQTDPAYILVNMADVKFIDSTGLATLVQGMKHCRQNNGDLYVCNLQAPVRNIFRLTRLEKAISVFNTETEALAAFEAR